MLPGWFTAPGIATSMPRIVVAACSSAICRGGGKRARAMPKNSRGSGSPTSIGFPMTNVEAHGAARLPGRGRKRKAGLDAARDFEPFVSGDCADSPFGGLVGAPMRIAQLAPLAESVPPKLYGGTERVVAWLIEELVELGHDVTLFASGDSKTRAKLVPVWPRALRLGRPRSDPAVAQAALLEAISRRAADFDVIHA